MKKVYEANDANLSKFWMQTKHAKHFQQSSWEYIHKKVILCSRLYIVAFYAERKQSVRKHKSEQITL